MPFPGFPEHTVTLYEIHKNIEYKKAWLKIESLRGGEKMILFPPVFFLSVIAMIINLLYKVKKNKKRSG